MQSVTRYSRVQTISWMRFVFLLLAFIASVAYAAPLDRRAGQPKVKVFFMTGRGEVIDIVRVHIKDRVEVLSKTKEYARPRVLELLQLIQDQRLKTENASPDLSLPGPIKDTIEWSDKNFYYPLAGKDVHEMAIFHIMTKGKPKYLVWMAYGVGGESGASTYASVMEVIREGGKVMRGKPEALKEVARFTGETEAEHEEWATLYEKFRSTMTVYSEVKFIPTEEKNWIAGQPAPDRTSKIPFKITFVGAGGGDVKLAVSPDNVVKETEAMKLVIQKLLRSSIPSLRPLGNPLPDHLPWTDHTFFVPEFTSGKGAPKMAFLRFERGAFVAYAWIAHPHERSESLCASIMRENGQELARVTGDVNNKDPEWEELNHLFLDKVSFVETSKFRPAPKEAWILSSRIMKSS